MTIEKEHKRSTLMQWSKAELIEHILCLEHNVNALHESFEQQYKNCMQIINDMTLINDTLKNVRKRVYEVYRTDGADNA